MKLMTYDAGTGPRLGLATDAGIVDLTKRTGVTSLRLAIAAGAVPGFAKYAQDKPDLALDGVRYLPPIPDPAHIFCVGVNYADHLQEAIDLGLPRSKTEHPVIFSRFADSLVGHEQPLLKSPVVEKFDYECELAAIIGTPGRYIKPEDALGHVAGYACFNEASARDWQYHTQQIIPGKNFYGTGGFGPWMVTADEIDDVQALDIRTILNGETLQSSNTANMIFDTRTIISYVSNLVPLQPGDVIATGTPEGVGMSRDPQVWMKPGDTCVVEIEKVGRLVNPVAEG